MTLIKENKDEQITELRKMVDQSDQSTQNEFEAKLHHRVAEFEQEKFEMQKQHTKAIQDILDDTNSRLHKMEMEYSTQVASHAAVIKELEARIQQLSQESENHRASQMHLREEKSELERRNALLSTEMDSVQARCSLLQMEAARIKDECEIEMRAIKKRADDGIDLAKREHALFASKSASTIHDLEQHVQELKQLLKNSENQRQRDLADLESLLKQDNIHQENLHKQLITELKSQLERERQENHSTVLKLQEAVGNKEKEIEKIAELKNVQSQQAEKALDDFKQQAEQTSGRMFKDMTAQIQRVEVDLKESEQMKRAQIDKVVRQLEQEKKRCQKQLMEKELVHTQKYDQLVEKHQQELKSLKKEHQHILAVTTDSLQFKLEENTTHNKQRHDRDAERISELEQQVHELFETNTQNTSLQNQLEVEIGSLRKEKEQAERAKENAQQECDAVSTTITRLKKSEENFSKKLAKSTENVRLLENTVTTLREESTSCRNQLEKQLKEAVTKAEDEKKLLIKQHITHLKSLHQDLDEQKSEVRNFQRQLQQGVFQHQDEMTHLKQHHEQKLKELLPHHIRKKLENTLELMKLQVTSLQQKNNVLQEEVEKGKKSLFVMPSPSTTDTSN